MGHLEYIKRVLRCRDDHYEVLGVKKEATDSEIRKAYKMAAFQLHPDKNRAPGAAEAFKVLGKAFSILSDAHKRKDYDYGRSQRYEQPPHFHYNWQQEYPPSHNFDSSFYQQQERQPGYQKPIIIMLIVMISLYLSIVPPLYSLTPTKEYSIARTTQNLQVPYYVKTTFDSDRRESLQQVETSVEKDYLKYLESACTREYNYKEEMLARAKRIKTPSCDALHRLQTA